MLLIEDKSLFYDVIAPPSLLWWKNNEIELKPIYTVELADGKLKKVIKYLGNENYRIGETFESLFSDT